MVACLNCLGFAIHTLGIGWLQEEMQFEVLRSLHRNSKFGEHPQVKGLGVGLGGVDFCFQAVAENGLVRMPSFGQNK